MPPAIPALQREHETHVEPQFKPFDGTPTAPGSSRLPVEGASITPIRPVPTPNRAQSRSQATFQPRIPVITGEAIYRGAMPVDGVISGQLGATGSTITIKQRPRNGAAISEPELDGEIIFKDMLRINGHVAGKVCSGQGTLIVDSSAQVDASIEVAV